MGESWDSRARRQRQVTAGLWRDLSAALRSETGLGVRSWTWWVVLAGLALGFELGRRGRRRLEGAHQPGAGSGELRPRLDA